MDQLTSACVAAQYELRFSHLFNAGKGFSFPCDANGQVDLDGLSESLRNNYFFARTLIGHELSVPYTRARTHPPGRSR
jgi:hypothetical protein